MVKTIDEKKYRNQLNKLIPKKQIFNPVEKALFTPKYFFKKYEENMELTLDAIRFSFKNQYENNFVYSKFCDVNNIKPGDIKTFKDLEKLPLLPDTFFKDYPRDKEFIRWLENIYTGDLPKITLTKDKNSFDEYIDWYNKKNIKIMFTSGTSGRFSFIPRNNFTWNYTRISAMRSVIELMDYEYSDSVVLLIPSPKKTNLTIASLFGIAYDLYDNNGINIALPDTKITTEFLRMQQAHAIGLKEKIKAKAIAKLSPMVQKKSDQKMIKKLIEIQKNNKRVNIAGPPFWLNRILENMRKENIKLDLEDSQVLTGGGWKAEESKRTPEEIFREKVEETLGIPQNRYHDVYALSECNSVFLSCQGHYKHIPPVIYPIVLDEDLKPVGYGKYGRFAFIDPLADSYPGFIITGDKVKILERCPVCNREGPVLDVEVSRIPGAEGRGCAAVMAELMQEE